MAGFSAQDHREILGSLRQARGQVLTEHAKGNCPPILACRRRLKEKSGNGLESSETQRTPFKNNG
jgi:hypothetical protein